MPCLAMRATVAKQIPNEGKQLKVIYQNIYMLSHIVLPWKTDTTVD